MKPLFVTVIIGVFVLFGCATKKQPTLSFSKLLVEYAENPINIDEPQPRFSWLIFSSERHQTQTAFRILVATQRNLLNHNTGDVWDSGKIQSSETIQHALENSKLNSNQKYFWKVIVWDKNGHPLESQIAQFETALLHTYNWNAGWIGKDTLIQSLPEKGFIDSREYEAEQQDTIIHSGQSLLLRKEVLLPKKIKSAKAFITGLGFYEFYINGKRVGDFVLTPAKTPYQKHILYDTYDVTDLLNKGENAIGIHLGNGWYNPYKKWWAQYRMQWFGHKKAIAQIYIMYDDGSTEIVKTDKSWKYNDGPISFNCIYDGEIYNANLEIQGWNLPGFNDNEWNAVSVFKSKNISLKSQTMPTIKVVQTIEPTEVKSAEKNVRVFDMGQNFTGWVRINIKGNKGDKIKIRFAEDLYEDGSIDITSNEHAKATAEYILKGSDVENYEPHFTYFGFKYVEVSTDQDFLDLVDIKGCVVYSANKKSGEFNCGNELVNKIHRATVWSQKSNMLGYPMDCPQRDERLGWFGDAQVTAEEALFNFDMALFYKNWFEGIKDNQDEKTGDLPIISPQPYIWDEGVEWSSTYIIMLWQYYSYYGDKRILSHHYNTMKRYMEFLDSISTDYILPMGWIGDWGSMTEGWKEGNPKSVPTAFYYFNARILSKIAHVIGEPEDVKYFNKLAENISKAYNSKYLDIESGNYLMGTQMDNAFPLFLGLVPENLKQNVQNNLVKDIVETNNSHLTTGVLGTKYMPEALAQFNREDVVWEIINQQTYPSWNSMMEKYTTMCEFWTLKQSKNHVMMGSIDAWFYKYIAGIQLDENNPAFSSFIIKPNLLNGLTHAEGKTETIRGTVSSFWKKEPGRFTLEVEVPFNSSAKVYIPGNQKTEFFESGTAIKDVVGVEYLGYSTGTHQLKVYSGKYKFETKEN